MERGAERTGKTVSVQVISDEAYADLLRTRATRPVTVVEAYATRKRRSSLLRPDGTVFLVAADHPARAALGVGSDSLAMADRRGLLERLALTLAHPDVDGLLATPDIVEELLLLGALEDKIVIGSMNRAGLAGASWELDDRFTAYDATSIARCRLDGGKMLLRIDEDDPGTLPTITACAQAVGELADHGLVAMVEPLPYTRGADGKAMLDRRTDRLIRAVTVSAALGRTSAYTWLKLPGGPDTEQVMAATTLPALVLGGAPDPDPEKDRAAWARSLACPNVYGLVVGRALLYPPDGDVTAAVESAARLLRPTDLEML